MSHNRLPNSMLVGVIVTINQKSLLEVAPTTFDNVLADRCDV